MGDLRFTKTLSPDNGESATPPSDRHPVEELSAQFVDRHRRGERPSIEEYAHRYPELAAEIRELFPTVAAMEGLQRRIEQDVGASTSSPGPPIERLGDFRVIGEIGRGGMGIVYDAEQESLGRRVAVKVLRQQAIFDEKELRRFEREAKTAARLHHSNIVQVFGVGEQDGLHYIVMQLIHGVGLDEILHELRRCAAAGGDGGAARGPDRAPRRHDSSRAWTARLSATALVHQQIYPESRATGTSRSAWTGTCAETGVAAAFPNREPAGDRVTAASSSADPATRTEADAESVTAGATHGPLVLGPEYWRNVARLGVQVADAVQYAHAHGTLHRDIKPGNILLDRDGVAWVVDFGLATAAEHGSLTWTGDVVGTIGYLAPERFHGHADERSDVFSIGLTLYEMLTLRRAFADGDRATLIRRICTEEILPPRKLNPKVPRDLDTIVQKAVANRPADRYQTAEALAADLQRFLEDRPIRARRTSPAERLTRWARRNPSVAGLAGAVAALLVLAACLAAMGYARQAAERQRAEATAGIAVEALDDIYAQFSPEAVQLPTQAALAASEDGLESESPPLSRDVAVLLENLLQFYDRLSNQITDNSAVVAQSIMAGRRVGDIRYRLGEMSTAEAAYRQAIVRFEKAGPIVADNPSLAVELARIYNGLGRTLEEQGKPVEARAAHLNAMDILRPAETGLARDFELARTCFLLHVVENKRRWGEDARAIPDDWKAHNHVREAISLLVDQTQGDTKLPQVQFLLARCYLVPMAERVDKQQWDEDAAEQEALRILESLVAQHPEVSDFRFALAEAGSSHEFWRLWRRRERRQTPAALDRAEQNVRRSLEITKNLELTQPNIPAYLNLQVKLRRVLASVLADAGRVEESLREYRRAVETQQSLIRLTARPSAHRMTLARVRLKLASVSQQLERFDESRTALEAAIDDLKLLDRQAEDRGRARAADLRRKAEAALATLPPAKSA